MSAFDQFYSSFYGARWEGLKAALLMPGVKVERSCFNGFAHYGMDQASIRAAQALKVEPGEQVLDICAAPGGKTLVLAESLLGSGQLVANELSSSRRLRLKTVIESHVPEEFRKNIQVTAYDGNQFGLKRASHFDRVLLDAPCSSEHHLLELDPEQMSWKESRTKQLAQRQYSLLCSGLLSLKPGGVMIYSTCSISPLENDGVIERLLKRKQGQVLIDPETQDLSDLEKTEYGFQIFPDRFQGMGPIFMTRLIKMK
jgi:16S rRNA C967 or C1407 C5-methylase (RsmB/RsmF family)